MIDCHQNRLNESENRLNESESRTWDKCYIYFVRTGRWPMNEKDNKGCNCHGECACESCPGYGKDAQPIELTDKMLAAMDNDAAPFEAPQVKDFMADTSGRGRYPGSRDWDMECWFVKCLRSSCVANYKDKCTVPSRISICSRGRCNGYQER